MADGWRNDPHYSGLFKRLRLAGLSRPVAEAIVEEFYRLAKGNA